MISEEIQNLIVSWLSRGCSLSQIADLLQNKISKRSIYCFASENVKKVRRKPKKPKKQPRRNVTQAMVRRMVRMLTIGKAHHSFRSVANALQLNESTVRYHLQYRNIKCFNKIKRNLIPETQKEARQKCAMNLRKTNRMFPTCSSCTNATFVLASALIIKTNDVYGYSLETISDRKKFKQFSKTALCAMVFGAVFFSVHLPSLF
ncbi:hypothetical protein BV898_19325 [Hypsibius exemplaris]|uniref:Uncharacterized protein n=1 Tax=Hypsibius exemplaris TaxID=2072580 RepID=A0A9X6NLF8_HYPEX|nr:hypothetical protein BV898_19325 [Hypsibius exemplaris]